MRLLVIALKGISSRSSSSESWMPFPMSQGGAPLDFAQQLTNRQAIVGGE